MQVRCGSDAAEAAAAVSSWLENEPVVHSVPATVLGGILAGDVPISPEHGFRWMLARDARGAVAGLALCNPPWPVVVAGAPDAADAFAARLAGDGAAVTGVTGVAAAADAFAARWCAATGAAPGRREVVLVYRLDELRPPDRVAGAARVAGPPDRDLLIGWAAAFDREINIGAGGRDAEATVDARLRPGRLWMWETGGRPVAMAAVTPRVAGVPRVHLVYTPPDARRRGYASALVAALSAHELATGAVACTLNAELTNPTSNRIYRRLGYRAAAETADICFVRP